MGRALVLGGFSVALLAISPAAGAQEEKNEIGLVIGGAVTPNLRATPPTLTPRIEFDGSVLLGAEYDRLLAQSGRVALYVGVDFEGYPRDVRLRRGPAGAIRSYRLLFLTPKVRLKFNPQGNVSPWLAFGGGYARFTESSQTLGGGASGLSGGTNTGTATLAGGVDFRTPLRVLVPIGLRVEVRDHVSGKPRYGVPTRGDLQHTVAFAGGLVLHF